MSAREVELLVELATGDARTAKAALRAIGKHIGGFDVRLYYAQAVHNVQMGHGKYQRTADVFEAIHEAMRGEP